MGENLLSPLHIQKLGHNIEEIRVRALYSVTSKYNLNLVDESNLENTKLLLEKLLDWFEYENCPEQRKVLSLLLKVFKFKNADLILKEVNRKVLLQKIKKIEKVVGCEHQSLVQDILKCITSIAEETDCFNHLNHAFIGSEVVNGGTSSEISEFPKDFYSASSRASRTTDDNTQAFAVDIIKSDRNIKPKSIFKVEFFPWQHLTPNDKEVLSSVYDGLRYINNKVSVLKSCQFFIEVVLRDFPTEVFIQRPSVIKTFLQLMEYGEQDIRIPVIKCLIKTAQCLKKSILQALNASLFNTKKEFYTTSVFPDSPDDGSVNFNLCVISFDDDLPFDDNGYIDPNLKKYQLSVPQFCFESLMQVLSHLGKPCAQEELNNLLNLTYEIINCLILNLNSEIWTEKDLRNRFYKLFGKLCEVIKFQKGKNPIVHVILLYFVTKLLNSLKPPSGIELSEILVAGLQSELGSCVSDFVLHLLFPQLHREVYKYTKQFLGQKEKDAVQDHREVLVVLESMKSTVKFLNCYRKLKTRMEKLECMLAALPSLDFHQNVKLVQFFVSSCLLKWRKCQLKEDELKVRDKILIKLLAHCNDSVRTSVYKEIYDHAVKLLGADEAKIPRFEFPGDQLDFLFRTEILTEIICHGLSSPLEKVRRYSSEIIHHLLKSKFIMSDICWSDFINALIPCLGLLQCYTDKSSLLGRWIVKMFDPYIAKTNVLPPVEILKGNMRFLFSKNNLTRDEALSRLFWLLSREDHDSQKLPRMSVLTGLNLSGICSCVKPQEFSRVRHSFYSPDRLCDVLEMLNSENVEPKLRRSALSQLAVMMEDSHLHQTFLEQGGLENVLQILDNCLIEREYRNYPDSVKPIIDILKALAFHNVCVRQELSCHIGVMYNILRGLFMFSSDDTLRQNAVELICLLLYSDCILRVPSDPSVNCTISFPDLVVNRMCLPFLTHVHWRNSRHFEPSLKSTLMSKPNCSKLIRISWAVQWVGSLSDVMATQPSDLPEKTFSPGLPDDMKVTAEDLECLKTCSFSFSVKQILFNIQNATTHDAVFSSLGKLHSYFLLYNIDKATNGKKNNDVGSETTLSHMLWESTLERFMTAQPSCSEDECLLLQVIRLVQLLLRSFKSERLIDWVGKLLIDDHQPLISLLKNIGNETFGLVGKELRLAIIELTQQIVTLKPSLDRNKWFVYLELASDHLQLDKKNEFYYVACIDWFLSLLVDLTGNWNWNFEEKTKFLEKLIVRVMEVIVAFHCTKDSAVSFMGVNIVRNSLLLFNYLMTSIQNSVKGWEKVCYQALSKVIGQERETNYCWMLSLWFIRDPVTRGAAYALFVSFSTTSLSCDLLIDQLKIQFDHVWSQTFKVLFDENECSFVREKAAFLLSNLTGQGTKSSCGSFLQHLQKINFYQEVYKILSNYDWEPRLSELWLHDTINCFSGQVITTPSFVTAICTLLTSVVSLNPREVAGKLLEFDIIGALINVLGDIPESAHTCGKHQNGTDILRMYTNVCRLLTKAATSSCSVLSFILQSQQCISYLFSMINYTLFCNQSKTVSTLRTELWTGIFDLFSTLLLENSNCDEHVVKKSTCFFLINKCMTDNGVDQFISSLYLAMTSDDPNLRTAIFKFFINLFRHELITPKHISICDIFGRKISEEALKLAASSSWKVLSLPVNLTLNFGIRAADVLRQILLLGSNCSGQVCKTTIADCLGSLLAVCKPAQSYCIDRGLADSLILNLKQICVRLNLENVDNLKKPSSKKKISPLLADSETMFRLICNLVLGNAKAKSDVADCALSTVAFKLWPWCMAKPSLHVVALKMLCTFTHSCDQACRTLVLSGSLSKLGLKKSPGAVTLMSAIMNQVNLEMEVLSSNPHDSQILRLCLQLLTNCSRVTECRSLILKGNFLQSFTKLHPNRKKRNYSDSVVESWLKLFIGLSSHQDGQLILTKSQDFLDVLKLKSTSTNPSHRIDALSIFRNLCFHKLNRVRMLGCCSFLSLMFDTLDSKIGEEVQAVAVMIWALTCNSQKAKLIVRSSGFETKLVATKRRFVMSEDTETADLVDTVLRIIRNR